MTMPESGGGDFLERMLNDLVGFMGGSAGAKRNQVELARTFAHSIATSGEAERNVEPIARMQLEELARVAELHVSEITGLPVTPTGGPAEIVTVGPGLWAWHTLEDWRFVLEAMSGGDSQSESAAASGAPADDSTSERGRDDASASDAPEAEQGLGLMDLGGMADTPGAGGPADVVNRFMSTMGPMLASMQVGSVVGHLARSTLAQYELPVPRPTSRILMIPQNIERFAVDWSLQPEEVRLWVCLRELTANAVLTRPHVGARMRELITGVVNGAAEDSSGALNRLGEIDFSDPEGVRRILEDPETLLASSESPERRRASDQLGAVTAALLGYIEHVLDVAGTRLLGERTALAEAWRRRQRERSSSDKAAEVLLGLDLGTSQIERGSAFVNGVIERAGEEGLSMLWSDSHTLPTPPEVEAPGLWLERLRLGG